MNLDLSSRQGAAQVPGWKRRWTFLLAATGSAFGLGNIWKLPYIIGENGGGAFVLVFLLCILLIGVPIMMAETLLGRLGRANPVATMGALAVASGSALTGAWRRGIDGCGGHSVPASHPHVRRHCRCAASRVECAASGSVSSFLLWHGG